MRVSLGGRYTISELAAAFDRLLLNFSANGIDEIQAVTLYVSLVQDRRRIELTDDDGNIIEHLKYDEPQRKRFAPATSNIYIVPPLDQG